MRNYADFVRKHFRRIYLTPAQLMQHDKIAISKRQDHTYPKPVRQVDITAKPKVSRVYRMLTMDEKKKILLKRYGSLTNFEHIRMWQT